MMVLVTTVQGLESASASIVDMIRKSIATAAGLIPGTEKVEHISFFAPGAMTQEYAPPKQMIVVEMKFGMMSFERFQEIRNSVLPALLAAAKQAIQGHYPGAVVLCRMQPFDLSGDESCLFSVPETVSV